MTNKTDNKANKTKKQMNKAEMKKAKGGYLEWNNFSGAVTKQVDGSRYGNAREANITADQKQIIGG